MKIARADVKAGRWKAGAAIASLIAALAVFAVMLQAEKNILKEYEKGVVYVAAAGIPKGQQITEENKEQYIEAKEVDKGCIADSFLDTTANVGSLAAVYAIAPGTVLTEEMFERTEQVLEQLKEPVIAGFKGEDLYQIVGGVLRAGDRIHIYSVSEEGETSLLWENVYVQNVFDQSGTVIENADTRTGATRINVYLSKGDVEAFYGGLSAGNLRVVKVCN